VGGPGLLADTGAFPDCRCHTRHRSTCVRRERTGVTEWPGTYHKAPGRLVVRDGQSHTRKDVRCWITDGEVAA